MRSHTFTDLLSWPLLWRLALVCCLSLAPPKAFADEREHKVEAVLLYNFFNYITWPGYLRPDDMKERTLCVEEGDPIVPYMEYIQHKAPPDRSFTTTVLTAQAIARNAINGCRMLFVRRVDGGALPGLRAAALEKETLLVSETPDFINKGGMIGLTPSRERIAIDIDNSLLKQANFQVSSRLLDLASRVE